MFSFSYVFLTSFSLFFVRQFISSIPIHSHFHSKFMASEKCVINVGKACPWKIMSFFYRSAKPFSNLLSPEKTSDEKQTNKQIFPSGWIHGFPKTRGIRCCCFVSSTLLCLHFLLLITGIPEPCRTFVPHQTNKATTTIWSNLRGSSLPQTRQPIFIQHL